MSINRRRGASTVEFALVAPILFMLIFGMLEVGWGYTWVHLLTNAAHIGCSKAAIASPAYTTQEITQVVRDNLKDYVTNREVIQVKVEVHGADADASTAKSGDEITVIAMVKVSDVIPVPGFLFRDSYLKGEYTLLRE